MTIATGTKLGCYEIRSQLGKGGMGEVYLAEDTRLHRKVALKILPAELAANQDRMRRFEQEAQAAAALNHPHIAHIYEIGESGSSPTPGSPSGQPAWGGAVREGVHFIAMEYIDGETLREKIHRDKAPLAKLLKYLTNNIVLKIPIDGGDEVQLTDKPGGGAVISPDGKLIACNYQDEASRQFKIAIIPFEGGPPTRLFDLLGGPNRNLWWTADGRAIAYIVTSNSVSNIWAQPLAGGEPKPLTDFKDQRIFNFAWSRDGKQLALSRGVVNSDVVLISGFR